MIDAPTPDEVTAASSIWREAELLRVPSPPYDSYLEDQRLGFIDTVSRADAWLTVAIVGSDAVGLVGGLRPGTDQPAAYLGYIAVDVSHRRRGIGLELMRHASTRAAEMGASVMLLTVHETNAEAQRLYERVGWLRTGRTESTPIDQEQLVEYSLTVTRR